MKSSIKNIIIFSLGAFTGGAVTWCFIKNKYEQLANDEIESVKSSFHHAVQAVEKYQGGNEPEDVVQDEKEIPRKKSSASDAVPYNTFFGDTEKTSLSRNGSEHPYIISPDFFGEYEDYEPITLIYYADGILADEDGDVIDDVNEVVGLDSLSHFGEYEDDTVFIRNDILKCDYEVLRDERNYSDIAKTMPRKL